MMVFRFTLKDLKNYKAGREKAESIGKIIVLKNKQPAAGFFSRTEYQRLLVLIEYLESLEGKKTAKVTPSLVISKCLSRKYRLSSKNKSVK